MSKIVVDLVEVTKTFGPTKALDRVSLSAFEGEVHAIIGGNGSGKSTLAKVISGVLLPDAGQVSIFGKSANSPSEAKDLGIANVYQEVLVADECTVAENLFMGADGLFEASENAEDRNSRAGKILSELVGLDLDPNIIVGDLPLSFKQWITIARSMLTEPKLLILDESSAALDFESTERLFSKMRSMKANGCTIFIVTHRIAELTRIADRATVLRDGKSVGKLDKHQINEDHILELIAGPQRKETVSISKTVKKLSDQPILRANDIKVWPATQAFDFNLCPGEIVGVTGLDGQGQAEFVKAISGVKQLLNGKINVIYNGQANAISDLQSARENGISYISGDRKKEGLFQNLSVFENMCLSIYQQFTWGGFFKFINKYKLNSTFVHETSKLATKMGDEGDLITSLSGGNQQKILIARSFAERPTILVLNDPARGIDVGAKLDLYRNLREFSDKGNGVIFLSSEIEEFLDLCNRVIVFRAGVIKSQFMPPLDSNKILNSTFGKRSNGPSVEKSDEKALHLVPKWPRYDNGQPVARDVRVGPNLSRKLKMNQSGFLLLAPDIAQGGTIPDIYAENKGVSPMLEWEGVPRNTESFALSITDPDVPSDFNFPRNFAHWLVYNIPANARHLPRGASGSSAMPLGSKELNSDFVTLSLPGFSGGYAGPWPPDCAHRYIFTLYALKVQSLDLKEDAKLEDFAASVLPVTIEQASFTAVYGPSGLELPAA